MAINAGWQMSAQYTNTAGTSINIATVSFTTPPAPNDAGNHQQEILYYFPYLMNVNHTELLQPILTWDASVKMWEVYVGYFHGSGSVNGTAIAENGTNFLTSQGTLVEPGQVLTAILASNLPEFPGGAVATIEGTHSSLFIPDITQGSHSVFDGPLSLFGVALEQYGVTDPNFVAPNITFSNIQLIINGQAINPASEMQPLVFYENSGDQVNITGQGIDLFHS